MREPRFELGSRPWQGQILTTVLLTQTSPKTEQSFIYLSQKKSYKKQENLFYIFFYLKLKNALAGI
ncbi:MAG: hypothetical protein QT08_C0018G0001, partial [archaeon GW2011_AR17]